MSKNKETTPVVSAPSSATAKMITIDGTAYSLDELSNETKQQVVNVRAVDMELAALQRQRGIATVARAAYANAVSAALPKAVTPPQDGARSVVIDGVAHDWASLGERVQGLLTGIRAAEQELSRINSQVQMAQTARMSFAGVIQQSLPKKAAAKA